MKFIKVKGRLKYMMEMQQHGLAKLLYLIRVIRGFPFHLTFPKEK